MAYSRVVTAWLISMIVLLPVSAALPLPTTSITAHNVYLALLMLATLLAMYTAHRGQRRTLRNRFWWVLWGLAVAFLWTWY